MILFDAHNHLQDERLDSWRAEMMDESPDLGITEVVVNGTCAEDWPKVAKLSERGDWVRPAFGLHPWYVKQRGADWRERLEEWLLCFPRSVMGEIGLDRWIAEPDLEAQCECFEWQLKWAAAHDRAVTIHCLKAHGLLMDLLRVGPRIERGFLLHSYGGPLEMVAEWVKMGGYFSISPYFAGERKRAQWEVFKRLPLDRLLIETDAPDMRPPLEMNPRPLVLPGGEELNHPANIVFCYEWVAELRGMAVEELAERVALNYRRLFG